MILTFRDQRVQDLFDGGSGHPAWEQFRRVARRKLLMLDAAGSLGDLENPPNNRLEPLKRDRTGRFSIRINRQYRVCLVWRDGHAYDVEIVDDH